MSEVLSYLGKNQANILQTLERFVQSDSPSNSKELCDRCGRSLRNSSPNTLESKEKFFRNPMSVTTINLHSGMGMNRSCS